MRKYALQKFLFWHILLSMNIHIDILHLTFIWIIANESRRLDSVKIEKLLLLSEKLLSMNIHIDIFKSTCRSIYVIH